MSTEKNIIPNNTIVIVTDVEGDKHVAKILGHHVEEGMSVYRTMDSDRVVRFALASRVSVIK